MVAACVQAAGQLPERIKVGQLGTLHHHASAKMATLRKLHDHYEVVGVVEPDPATRKKHENDPAYRDLKWMTEEELFNTTGLQAVAVETEVADLASAGLWCVEAGSRGVHQLDIALWGLNIKTHPTRIAGFGEKLYFDDDKQYPDTQYATFEYPAEGPSGAKRLIIYEQRIWTPYWGQVDCEDGCRFYGDEGYLTVDMHEGWKLFGPKNVLRKEVQKRFDTGEHCADFLDAIRNSRRPCADIEIGHFSASLPHLANILARTGRGQFTFDPRQERFLDAPDADLLIRRTYRDGHWARL